MDRGATELPRLQASAASAEQVEPQLSTPQAQQRQVDSVVTVATPQRELAATAEPEAQQLALLRVQLQLVGSVVSAATQRAEHQELAAPVARRLRKARIPRLLADAVVSAEHQYLGLAASAVSADKQPVLRVQHLASQSVGSVVWAEHQSQVLAASAVSAVLLHRRRPAPTPTLVPKPLAASVEWAEPPPPADVAAPAAQHWSIAINGQPRLEAPEESVARSAVWVD